MTVYAAFWEADHLAPVVGVGVVNNTTTTFFNSANARSALQAQLTIAESRASIGSALSELWFHTVYYTPSNHSVFTTGIIIFQSAANANAPQVRIAAASATTMKVEYTTNGTTWTQIGSSFTVATASAVRIDLHLKLHSSTGEMQIYINESLATSFSGTLTTFHSLIDSVYFTTEASGLINYFSECFVADTNTLGWKLKTLAPTGAGATTGWTGAYSDVDEITLDPTDLNTTNTTSAVQLYQTQDITVGGDLLLGVAALVTRFSAAITPDSTPNDVQAVLRISGTDYPSASAGVAKTSIPTSISVVWNTNPATSSPFSPSEVNLLEAGVKAVA